MKGKKIVAIALPAILGSVIFSSLTIGTSFALFTSYNETQVSISSGMISITPVLREYDPVDEVKPQLKTYSAVVDSTGDLVDEHGNHYRHELQEFNVDEYGNKIYSFSQGGYATYTEDPGVISLANMIPGDKVKFQYDITNASNIAIKYRFTYKVVDPNNLGDDAYALAKGLHTDFLEGTTAQIDDKTADITSFDGLKEYGSDWTVLAPGVNPDSLGIEISLPMDAGNIYQNKSAVILLTFESIQGNATTFNDAPVFVE